MKILMVIMAMAMATPVLAQTAGDQEALAYLELANDNMTLANTSSGEEAQRYVNKAATAANMACNLATTENFKAQACAQASRLGGLVKF